MNPNRELAKKGQKFVLAVAGGGQKVIGSLLKYGGMSDTLLAAHTLQACGATDSYIGYRPEGYANEATARLLAMRAYQEVRELSGRDDEIFGVGATSSLAKDGEREGRKHVLHIAVQTPFYTHVVSVELHPGLTRLKEEKIAATLIRGSVFSASKLWPETKDLPLDDADVVRHEMAFAEAGWHDLLHGKRFHVGPGHSQYVLPTSCNPIHDGHIGMMGWVHKHRGESVDLELCVKNADKPPLDYVEISHRLKATSAALKGNAAFGGIHLTSTGLFAHKRFAFIGPTTFLVGTDTLTRIGHFGYYHNDWEMVNSFEVMKKCGHKLLVFPRPGCEFSRWELPTSLRDICEFVDDDYIPVGFSSSEIRNAV